MFDEAKAREFYVGFLGFEIAFEHRFGDDFPLYLGLTRGTFDLHLSEHHGDGCPGARIRVRVDDIRALSAELGAKDYKFAKPGSASETAWGTLELTITDPFGNAICFVQEN